MAETYTLYKLIVLYMLDKVDFPLTTSQISEFILDKGYTTYFRLQETLSELTDSELLKIETTHNLSLIHISEPTRRTPISYAVFCLKKKKNISEPTRRTPTSIT